MRRPGFHAALAVLCTIWLLPPAFAAAIASEQEARTAAASFAQAVNWPYGPPSGARLDDVPGHGALWRVEFSGAALVFLDPATGQIVAAPDLSQCALLDSAPEPVEAKVGEQEARETAERVLDVVVRPADARFLRSEKSRDNKEWRFVWVRVFHDIEYRHDMMAVGVSAIDGKMLGFGRAFLSAPPPSAAVKLTESEALAAARQTASSLGIPEAEAGAAVAELRVVQPNNYWGPGPVIEGWRRGGPSRVAWMVTISHDGGRKEFWIDAADGSLLGGTQTKGPGFTPARLGEKAPGAGAQALRPGSIGWPIIGGVALPLALLLLFLLRRSGKGKAATISGFLASI